MKKIVIFTSSPRKNSNTTRMAKSFADAAITKGNEVEWFDTYSMDIKLCAVCNSCFKNGKPCVFNDDFNKAAEAMLNADVIVFAAPVYWYTLPAQIVLLLDKLYSFYTTGKNFEGKECVLISCCGDKPLSTFDGTRFAFEKTFKELKCNILGEVLIPGVQNEGEIAETDGEKQAAALADRL